jgi:neutral trehalase
MSTTQIRNRLQPNGQPFPSRYGSAPYLPIAFTRDQGIAWLLWNDPNGCYSDADARAEGWPPMTYDDVIEALILVAQDL